MIRSAKSFIGRERELVELELGLDEAAAGAGGLFLLVGEPGIGKTRVADEVARCATERGFSVHWGRCWEVGGAPAFWPWIQVFRSQLREPRCKSVASAYGAVLSRLLPELRSEGVATDPNELDQAQARFQLFDELWALERAIAEQVPLLLVLDDLHAADPSSLALLQFVARDLRASRAVVLVTYRDRDAQPIAEVAETIRAITRDGTFLPIRRLDLEEVRLFLDTRAGRPLAAELAVALHTATEGNPLFMDQVFRVLEARTALDAPPSALPIPEGLLDMIRARIAALDGPSRELLEAAAVLGREFGRSLLAAVCQRDEASLREPLLRLLRSGIVAEPSLGSYEFSHGLFREALYRDLPAATRAELHARTAAALESASAPEKALGEIAAHLLAAASVVGAERALSGAMQAGQRALGALAFEDAATILTQALAEVSVSAEQKPLKGRALVLLTEALARSCQHELSRKSCQEAATIARDSADPTLLAEAALALGVDIVPGVIPTLLVTLLQEAQEALPKAASPLRAKVLARLAAALQPAEDPEQPMEFARAAVAMARALGDAPTLRACLHMGGSALADYAEPSERLQWDGELLRMSIDAGDAIASLRAHARLIFDYLELGQTDEADAQISAHGRLADELGLPRYQWLTLMLRALRAISEGRFEQAEALRDRARRVGQRTNVPEMAVATQIQAWGMALTRGDPLPNLAETAEATAHMSDAAPVMLAARIFEHARRGEFELARNLLLRIPEDSPTLTRAGPHLRFLAEACVRLRDAARAAPIYRTLFPIQARMLSWGRVGLTLEGPTDWLLGMLASAMRRWDDAARHFEDALERCERAQLRPAEAITCLEYARSFYDQDASGSEKCLALLRRGSVIAKELEMAGVLHELELLGGVQTAPPQLAAPATSERETATVPGFSLKRDGELWACISQGRSFRLKDSRGMQMLVELVLHPNREFHVLTLVGSEASDDSDAGELLDREAISSYRERVEDLREQLAEAESWGDSARASSVREKLDAIAAELARGVGLGGRSRRAGAAAERARVNVQRRLRDAIKRVAEHDPKLGRHLDRAVRTGTFCAYEPN